MLKKLKRLCSSLWCKLNSKFKITTEKVSDSANTITFEKLTPTHIDNLGIYKDALDFALNSDDVKNIAITGDYGAGKSSVLLTYEDLHPERKFVHISLAHFGEDNKDNINSKELTNQDSNQTHINESVIEGKILNQLIHQIDQGKIPQTNFKIKKAIRKQRLFMASIATTIYLMLLIYVFKFEKWCSLLSSDDLKWLAPVIKWTKNNSVRFFALIVIFAASAWLIYFLIRLQKTRNILKKLNVQGTEIELFGETNDSFFDKYLNEVLYLFENIDADIIVFEDIDRFDDVQIFERLREINTLANLQRKQSHKGIIRFFYLLKDDIFTSKDRTKFFDYIMPIIPVIDGSNSYNKFISQLKAIGMYEKLDDHFLQDLSLYVDDMRLLKNICNEFQIYQSKLNTIELDNNKMLAIITYKNLFPRDFSDLQTNKGFVHALFANKKIFASEEIDRIDKQIEDKTIEIDRFNKEIMYDKRDLNYISDAFQSKINNSRYSERDALEKEFSTWKKNVYPEKLKLINIKETDGIAKLELEVEALKAERQRIVFKPLYKIITNGNIDRIFDFSESKVYGNVNYFLEYEDVKGNSYFDLLKYLIRNGYIDETYPDYMTYFYEDSLCIADKLFLRSIADQKRKEYAYNITAPSKVLSRLRPVDLEKEEALNFSLTEYLFSHNLEYIDYIKSEITQLKAGNHFDFIDDYLGRDEGISEFAAVVIPQWHELFSAVIPRNNLSSVNIKKLVISAIYSCSDEDILNANVDNIITDYISSSPDFLNIPFPRIDRLISAFSFLKVSFHSLDYAKSDTALFNAVYESGCYDLTFQNIELMLRKMYNVDSEYDIRHKNLTLIMKDPASPLVAKVHSDMNVYMKAIIAECDGGISDDESVMIGILNDKSITEENKDNYCSAAKTKIQLLHSIDDKGAWSKWIEAKIVEICEKNVIDYFLYTGKIDNILISFINTDGYSFNFKIIKEDYRLNYKDFFEHIIKCNELTDKAYREILMSLDCEYKNFSVKGLNASKVAILVDIRIIRMDTSSLDFMRINYPDCVKNYIRENIDEYVNLMNSSIFKSEELLAVLSMDVQVEQKLALLKFMKSPVSVVGKGYPDKVIEYILENNLNENDVPALFNEYNNYSPSVQNAILKIAVKKINTLINRPDSLSGDLIRDIMHHDGLSAKIKFNLLIVIFPSLDKSSAIDYLPLADKGEFTDIFDSQKRPKFVDDPDNQKLLKAFKDKGLIHEYYKNNDGLWQIRRREQRKKK